MDLGSTLHKGRVWNVSIELKCGMGTQLLESSSQERPDFWQPIPK